MTSWSRDAWISAVLRATFQMRTSSTVPAKKPAAVPLLVSALPTAACWMLVDSGVKLPPRASVRSSVPSRYSRHVSEAVSYTAAAWCHTFWVTAVVPETGWFVPLAVSSKSATSTPVDASMPRK